LTTDTDDLLPHPRMKRPKRSVARQRVEDQITDSPTVAIEFPSRAKREV
jgi:hypothetical protein